MGYFPVFLELAGRACLVVGGGPVARKKVEALLAAEASVTVVSPVLIPRLDALALERRIGHLRRQYRAGDLAGSQLAFVAASDSDTNAAVAREGRERGVWVNAADDATHSDFILPSILRRGPLVVAVGTEGASPALSRAIREELEGYFTRDYAVLAAVAAEVRRALKERGCVAGAEAWRGALVDGDLRRLIAEGRREEAKARLFWRLLAGTCA